MEVTEKTLEETLEKLKQLGVPPETALGAIGVLETEEQFLKLQRALNSMDNLSTTNLLATALMIEDGSW